MLICMLDVSLAVFSILVKLDHCQLYLMIHRLRRHILATTSGRILKLLIMMHHENQVCIQRKEGHCDLHVLSSLNAGDTQVPLQGEISNC